MGSRRACVPLLVAVALLLHGCAPLVPRADKMAVASPSDTQRAPPAALRQNIAFVSGSSGPVEHALEASLRDAGLLSGSTNGRFGLTVQLIKLEEPSFGASMTVTPTVRYVLSERGTTRNALEKTITSPYTAEWYSAYLGSERKKMAVEGAFKANIVAFIDQLMRFDPPMETAAVAPTPTVIESSAATPPALSASAVVASPAAVQPETTRDATPPPAPAATAQAISQAATDGADLRAGEMRKTYLTLMQQARAGKLRYVEAARQYKEKFLRLYPDETANPVMNEYLAYMAVLGERIDRKRLTEVEAEYELARKEGELAQRVATMRAQAMSQAAAIKTAEDAANRAAADQAAAKKSAEDAALLKAQLGAQRIAAQQEEAARVANAQLEAARQQAALAAAIQAQAEEQRRARAAAVFLEGMRLLTPPPPPRMTSCRWFAQNWVCS